MSKTKKIISLTALILAIALGALYYHYYEYKAIYFKLSDGGSVTISRHNFNQMTAAQKQTFLHPVNENAPHTCVGNTHDNCIATPSIDFWPIGGESSVNPVLVQSFAAPNEIMGRITDGTTNTLQLKTSSGRTISIEYPLNTVTNFNGTYASSYGFSVTTGDEIYVSYSGDMHNNTIATNQIIRSSVVLKGNPKISTSKY